MPSSKALLFHQRSEEQGAAADENLPIVLIGSFEIADNRVHGGINRLVDDRGAKLHDVAFESRVAMSNRDFL